MDNLSKADYINIQICGTLDLHMCAFVFGDRYKI